MNKFFYGKDKLTVSIAISIARGNCIGVLSKETCAKINKSSNFVAKIIENDACVYGINTGFGSLCTTKISTEQTKLLQKNILMSHAVGVGEPIAKEIAKLMLILKVHSLSMGFSGVRLGTVERIIWHIDNDIIPVVPSQGSVGASGDLAPLAHLFLPLIGLGELYVKGRCFSTASYFEEHDLTPLELDAKEGLSLINGTQFITAFAIQVLDNLHNILVCADIVGAMMVEGLLGSIKPFSKEVHSLRDYKGSSYVASFVWELLENSKILHSHLKCSRVQDPYSLRCIAQVHGSSWNTWLHLFELLLVEMNSVTDNPIIFNENHTVSAGNFHGQLLALPLDYASIAASELGNISDRRIFFSLSGIDHIPKFLMKKSGLNSGFMIAQYTTAALASENKSLAFPASVDSITTSLGQEDHVSMGSISGRKAMAIIGNTEKILGIELLCACQALDFYAKGDSNLSYIHQYVREKIPYLENDTYLSPEIDKAVEIIKNGELCALVFEKMNLNKIKNAKLFHNY